MATPNTAQKLREGPVSADLAILRTAAEDAILARYPSFREHNNAWGTPALLRQRDAAFQTLKARGLPNRRVEEWKYTDLRAFMRDFPEAAPAPDAATVAAARALPVGLDLGSALRLDFVNGHYVAGPGSAPAGVLVVSLRETKDLPAAVTRAVSAERAYADNAAVALNTAFMSDTLVVHVAAGVQVAEPIHLAFSHVLSAPHATFPRVLVVAEDGASCTIVETHAGPNGVAYQNHSLLEIEAGEEAVIEHVRLDTGGDAALDLATLGVKVARAAQFTSAALVQNGTMTRQQMFLAYAGPDAKVTLGGAVLLRGRQHADNTLVVDHAFGGGESRELFKSVLDGESRSVFQGKIIVRPHAQKTDGKMMARALLLSEAAEANAKPELEIFADDVACGHGATVGALDDDLLFYLMARGIPRKDAEAMLIQSFVGEVFEPLSRPELREGLLEAVRLWVEARD